MPTRVKILYLFWKIVYSTIVMFIKTNEQFVISDILTDMRVINVSLHKIITHIETAKFYTSPYFSFSFYLAIKLLANTLTINYRIDNKILFV